MIVESTAVADIGILKVEAEAGNTEKDRIQENATDQDRQGHQMTEKREQKKREVRQNPSQRASPSPDRLLQGQAQKESTKAL